jgi:hypothetical protein
VSTRVSARQHERIRVGGDEREPRVHEAVEHVEEMLRVLRMEPRRRRVEDRHRALEVATRGELACKSEALRFDPRQGFEG